ncbi:MAG: lycopene cyclase domain-containing protein [Spirochaetaceae bacterium]|nr:lycopene cyclase domain-containing protein [Spirochaetaceae bacterium]MDT8298444.1 lycopene cyclase domain-containing protein [Spirochaetaceae bacterium]
MNAYLLINLAVILLPFALSFDRRVVFFRQWRAVFPAIILVGVFYIYEDILATSNGNWSFAEEWVGSVTILGLPPGEWLFFITVPYACVFIYACVRAYIPEKTLHFPRFLFWMTSAFAALCVWIFRDQGYTVVVMSVFAVTSLLVGLLRPDLLSSRQFWTALGISYGAFLVVNGVLTGVPVVLYGADAIWGIRVITIPLEDFFYNFCLLSLNYLFFRIFLDGGLMKRTGPRSAPAGSETGRLEAGGLPDPSGRRGRTGDLPPWRSPSPRPGEMAGPRGLGSTDRPILAYKFMERDNGA